MTILRQSVFGMMLLFAILTLFSATVGVAGYNYTAFDDASWAIFSSNLSTSMNRQHIYDAHIAGCHEHAGPSLGYQSCGIGEKRRLQKIRHQPSSMKNFTIRGFEKRRAPHEVMRLLLEFYHRFKTKGREEFSKPEDDFEKSQHNAWAANRTLISVWESARYPFMGGPNLVNRIIQPFQSIMEEWSSQSLQYKAFYGIRVYHNQSILAPHVDRLSLVIGAIINVDQDVDEDWPLEIYDHEGVSHNVTLQPGEMVLYESHTCIHGRPFPLQGRHYANAFVHFEPNSFDGYLPSYILQGSYTAKILRNITALIEFRDLLTLRYLSVDLNEREIFHKPICNETLWRPIHEACRQRQFDVVKFLLKQPDVDINAECLLENIPTTPLTIAKRAAMDCYEPSGKSCDDNFFFEFLMSNGAVEAQTNQAASKATSSEL